MTGQPARPAPWCPARHGTLTDAARAQFTLVVHDCDYAPGTGWQATEIFAYYSDRHHLDDTVLADGFEVPAGTPIAVLARHVAASRDAVAAVAAVAAVLCGAIAACPCTPGTTSCPALDQVSFLDAMEQAAAFGQTAGPGPAWPGRACSPALGNRPRCPARLPPRGTCPGISGSER